MQSLVLILTLVLILSGLSACATKNGSSTSNEEKTESGESVVKEDNEGSEEAVSSGVKANLDPDKDYTIFEEQVKVTMIVPDGKIARYLKFDGPYFEQYMKAYAPNAEVSLIDSEGDQQKQLQQVEAEIADGVDAIVLLPVDSNSAGGMLSALEEENVLSLTYAHEGYGGPVDYHITSPFSLIAENHAKLMGSFLEENPQDEPYKVGLIWGAPGYAFYDDLTNTWRPFLDQWESDGIIEIVYESDTEGWDATVSEPVATQMMTETQNELDIVITMNDDLGGGIVSALNAQGLAGEIKLYGGCDATLEGIARVQAGWQEADIAMDFETMADVAAQLIAYNLSGQDIPEGIVNGTFDNRFVEGGVPAAYVDNLLVTQDNIQEIIVDRGIHAKDQIDEIANNMK